MQVVLVRLRDIAHENNNIIHSFKFFLKYFTKFSNKNCAQYIIYVRGVNRLTDFCNDKNIEKSNNIDGLVQYKRNEKNGEMFEHGWGMLRTR